MISTSPLVGTAGVFIIMAALALPLRHLTQARGVGDAAAVAPVAENVRATTPALLRVKLLKAAVFVVIQDADGRVLLEFDHPPSGESEYDAAIPLLPTGRCDLTVTADFGPASEETALFLTVMPDAMEPVSRYLTGTGEVAEDLRFQWPAPHPQP